MVKILVISGIGRQLSPHLMKVGVENLKPLPIVCFHYDTENDPLFILDHTR